MKKIETPNKMKGRAGAVPMFFVIHMSEGSEESAINWIKNPESKVSYHYLVNERGEVTQFVDINDTAWHAGKVVDSEWIGLQNGPNPNYYTIGICASGFASEGPTFLQFVAIAKLLRILSRATNIPLDEITIVNHNQIRTDKTCPGPKFDRATLVELCSLRK